MPSKNVKCEYSVDDGITKMCFGLSSAMNVCGSRSGIVPVNFVNLNTHKSRTLAAVKSGEFKKEGLVMNHCPFCGTQIHTVRKEVRHGKEV